MVFEVQYKFSEYLEGISQFPRYYHFLRIGTVILILLCLPFYLYHFYQRVTSEGEMAFKNDFQLLAVVAVWLLLIRGIKWYAWKSNDKLRKILRFEISEEGVRIITQDYDSSVKWQGFQKTVESQNLFILYLTRQNRYIIPKRTFDNADQMQQFRDILLQKIQTA